MWNGELLLAFPPFDLSTLICNFFGAFKLTDETRGLLMVHTGDGKGKTTAALGLAIRAFGAGLKVLILQFIKGGQTYGELNALKILSENSADLEAKIEIRQCGLGFTNSGEKSEHQAAAEETLNIARQEILSGKWNLIILDEINYAVKFGLVSEEKLLELAKLKPPELHLLFTGRDASPKLIELADLVTEMKLVKHPFKSGIKAQRGIEF